MKIQILILAAIVGLAGCVKKRPQIYDQGTMEGKVSISAMESQQDTLTATTAYNSQRSTEAKTIEVEGNLPGISAFPLVNYTTTSKYLSDLPVRGRPGQTYKIRYKLEGRYLKVYKVVPASDLPAQEATYAVKDADGSYWVPLVGYTVSYYQIQSRKNDNNENTNVLTPVKVPTRQGADYFSVDFLDRKVFEAVDKIDVYPTDYFSGDWYYAETLVSTRAGDDINIGQMETLDPKMNNTTLVRFIKDPKYFRVVNVNIDKRLNQNDESQYSSVLSIPVEWKAYRIDPNGVGDAMKEVEDESIQWDKRPYIKMDFPKARVGLSVSEGGGNVIDTTLMNLTQMSDEQAENLTDIKIAPNYFSFVLLNTDTGEKRKFAFLRIPKNNDYPAVNYSSEDRKKFGFWIAHTAVIQDYHLYRRSDYEKYNFLTRFNPKKNIVYHISNTSPQDPLLVEVAKEAIGFWNRAFHLAGSDINISLDAENREDTGDIRYNEINFVDNLATNNLLGLGPSLADPKTGEIISATANIQVGSIKNSVAQELHSYVRQKLGLYGSAFSGNFPKTLLPAQTAAATQMSFLTLQELAQQQESDPNFKYFITGDNGQPTEFDAVKMISQISNPIIDLAKYVHRDATNSNQISTPELLAELQSIEEQVPGLADQLQDQAGPVRSSPTMGEPMIDALCPDLQKKIDDFKGTQQQLSSDVELQMIGPCLDTMEKWTMLATLVHELGHDFGLTHNFKGSVDLANSFTYDEAKDLYGFEFPKSVFVRSASIMDYLDDSWGTMFVPGKYDIAAIHFAYAPDKPMQIKLNSQPLYCYDIQANDPFDPTCAQFDVGNTPTEVVDNTIKSIQAGIKEMTFRLDANADHGLSANWWTSKMVILKGYYDTWRYLLNDEMKGMNPYLEHISAADYTKLLDNLTKGSDARAQKLKMYRDVRDKIFDFLQSLVYTPNQFCITQDQKTKEISGEELSKIRQAMLMDMGGDLQVTSCTDSTLTDYVAHQGKTVIEQVGLPYSSYSFTVDPGLLDQNLPESELMDVIGVGGERLNAMAQIATRMSSARIEAYRTFVPSMMDEPDLRAKVEQEFEKRVTLGVTLNLRDADHPDLPKSIILPKFDTSSSFLQVVGSMIMGGLHVGGRVQTSTERLLPFNAQVLQVQSQLQSSEFKTGGMVGNAIVGFRKENVYAIKFFESENASVEMAKNAAGISQMRQALEAQLPADGSQITSLADFQKFTDSLSSVYGQLSKQLPEGDSLISYFMDRFGVEMNLGAILFHYDAVRPKIQQQIDQIKSAASAGTINGQQLTQPQIDQLKAQVGNLQNMLNQQQQLAEQLKSATTVQAVLSAVGTGPEDVVLDRSTLDAVFATPDQQELDAKSNLLTGLLELGIRQ